MSKQRIKDLIERRLPEPGLVDTALKSIQLFRVTEAMPCVPAVYEPTVVAILSGTKEAVLDGEHHIYDSDKYLLCPMTLPVEAGTPHASEETPLLGVVITLEPRMLRALTMEIELVAGADRQYRGDAPSALALASWDAGFTKALQRLLELLKLCRRESVTHDPLHPCGDLLSCGIRHDWASAAGDTPRSQSRRASRMRLTTR